MVKIIEEHLGLKAFKEDMGHGVIWIENFEEIASASRKLRGLK